LHIVYAASLPRFGRRGLRPRLPKNGVAARAAPTIKYFCTIASFIRSFIQENAYTGIVFPLSFKMSQISVTRDNCSMVARLKIDENLKKEKQKPQK